MEQSPFWKSNRSSVSQEFPFILWKPEVLYKMLPTCPCLEPDQSSPCLPFHFFKIHFNIILPSRPRSFKWFFLSSFSSKPLYVHIVSSIPATCSAHFILLNLTGIWWGVLILRIFVMQSPPLPCYLVFPSPKYLPQYPILKNSQPMFLHQC